MKNPIQRTVERVRHDLKFRMLRVAAVEDLTPTLRRVVLEGDALEGLVSPGFDDHLKLFPPQADGEVILPTQGPDGLVFADPRPPSRDYTPRWYDPHSNRLAIDFVLGHGGPATDWALGVAIGGAVGVGGPRGSRLVPVDYAVHLLISDETGLPAVARRLEELPPGVRAVVFVEIDDEGDRIDLSTRADLVVTWVARGGRKRGDPAALLEALNGVAAIVANPDVYVWAAAEAGVAKAVRASLIDEGFEPEAMRIAGYWTLGASGSQKKP